ncbi:MAG: AbrB/MazE/SpoVT family DNA-binding domain-containing protein [Candidatus Eremiobacterota bacterium]
MCARADRLRRRFVQLNAKGQVTVPQSVRKSLGLQPGDVLELEARGETLILRLCASGLSACTSRPEGVARLGGDAWRIPRLCMATSSTPTIS